MKPDTRSSKLAWWCGELGLAVLVFAGLFQFPAPPSVELDPSWLQVLAYAWRENLQFGSDLVFTYGPLGFLLNPTNAGHSFYAFFIARGLIIAAFTIVILSVSRNFRGIPRGLVLGFFIILLGPTPEGLMMLMLVLATLAFARHLERLPAWAAAPLALFLAFGSLEKFTQLMFSAAAIGVLSLHALLLRRKTTALTLIATYALFLAALWVGTGQSLLGLPHYASSSLKVSSAYNQSMALPTVPFVLALGLLAPAGLLVFSGLALQRWRQTPAFAALACLALLGGFLHWKHGFVRADSHTAVHFIYQIFLAITLPLLARELWQQRRVFRVATFATVGISVIGLYASVPDAIVNGVIRANNRIVLTLGGLLDLPHQRQTVDDHYRHVATQVDLGQIRARIGESSVDVLGYEQGYAVLNGFNYQPRPVFQSYIATTAPLARLNADAFTASTGPQFVLQKIQPIDGRLSGLGDNLAMLAVMQHYRLTDYLTRFLVWERRPEIVAPVDKVLLQESTVTWDEDVAVPDSGSDPIWCEIDLSLSLPGRLRGLAYKNAELSIRTLDQSGFAMSYRYLPSAGSVGFLVAPHLVSTADLATYLSGEESFQRLKSLALSVRSGSASDFAAPFSIRFYRLTGVRRDAQISIPDNHEIFRSFSQPPMRQEALFPIAVLNENGADVLAAHPPSQMDFRVPDRATALSVGFGFLSAALPHVSQSDGVDFVLIAINAQGQVVASVTHRLEPATNPLHRELQTTRLALPPDAVLVQLKTLPGPANDLSFDWVYWRDFAFEIGASAQTSP